jgi:hypothetical protein
VLGIVSVVATLLLERAVAILLGSLGRRGRLRRRLLRSLLGLDAEGWEYEALVVLAMAAEVPARGLLSTSPCLQVRYCILVCVVAVM